MKEVVIIGGGASGIMCAISVKEAIGDHCNVTIVERLERVGKKILATGGGCCNFSNMNMNANKYNNPLFVAPVLNEFNPTFLRKYFDEMGLLSIADNEGRVYPYTDLASSVLDVLRNRLKNLGVIEKCGQEIKKVSKDNNQYLIETTRGYKFTADYVVMATGGKASPVLGSNGSGYTLLKPWKVKISNLYPGLVGYKVEQTDIKGLNGIRTKAKVRLREKKKKIICFEETGEIQFKEDGISGIVVMQMASCLARLLASGQGNNYLFELDLLPQMENDECLTQLILRQERMQNLENGDFLLGICHKMLAHNIFKRCRIDMAGYVKDLNLKDLTKISEMIKNFAIDLKNPYEFDKAQVTVGGIDLKEIDPKTLEIKKIKDIYACGELVDVDGDCGGYNLHWAFASGYVVGKNIAKAVMSNEENE